MGGAVNCTDQPTWCASPAQTCQLFNYLATTPTPGGGGGAVGALAACARFLRAQYVVARPSDGRLALRPAALRDVFMRCAYIAPQLSTFSAIERLCLDRLG